MKQNPLGILSQNQLKILAACSMVLDHLGVEVFPQYHFLRMAGRLAFPIFAYFIFEGARYTHRPAGYLGRMLAMGMVCVAGYGLFAGVFYGNILITFSCSLTLLWTLQRARKEEQEGNTLPAVGWLGLFLILTGAYAWLAGKVIIDYGIWGILLPVFAQLGRWLAREPAQEMPFSLGGFALGLVVLSMDMGGIQWLSLLALLLLALYSGQRGKWRMKQFFYWFYPLHLVLIYLFGLFIQG